MKNFKLIVFYQIVLWCALTSGYKILGIFPYEGVSHFVVFEPLLKALASKGHEITIVSHFPNRFENLNITTIDISSADHFISVIDLNDITGSRFQKYVTPILLGYLGYKSCINGLYNEDFQNLINSELKFDLIITELFNTECFLGVTSKLKTPLIGVSSCVLLPWQGSGLAMPTNPAYIPNHFMHFSDKMTFLEKAENTFAYFFNNVIYYFFIHVPSQMAITKYLGAYHSDITDTASNISILLMNSHFSFATARPVVPGYIEVGGIHITERKIIPQHIDKWINESTHGVIYFSLGSMIKGHTFPEEKRQMFVNAFSRFPERVLWKWETNTMPGKPDNIMIEKWMPQLEILCHPNVKAFIAHGGLLGITEAVHCGVPLIIIPQFGDQFTNAKAIEANGGGVILDYGSLDEESIYNAIKTVLDPRFNQQAKELSARFRDRPLPPLETAIYWVEYVARHKGAPHLRTAAVGMPLYQYLLLDVLAFLTVILLSILFIFYLVIRTIYRKLFRSKEKIKQN